MKLIDRYIYAVIEYLPENVKKDIEIELRTNIEDMLPENYTEEDVCKVLEELGSPWKLANEYNPNKRYLIGPAYYDRYISVLKLVLSICIFVFLGLAIVGWAIEAPVTGSDYDSFILLLQQMISAPIEGALQGAFWVTLVFVILERSGIDSGQVPFWYNKKFNPMDLPEPSVSKKNKISRKETFVSMFFTIFFIAIIYFKPQLFGVFIKHDSVVQVFSIFNIERLQGYFTVILIMAVIQLGLFIVKYITRRWTMPLALANACYNIVICILLVIMLNDRSLWNSEFVTEIAAFTEISAHTFLLWLSRGKIVTIIILIAINIIDSISAILKAGRVK